MTDCGCITHYFPESRKWAIYYCARHGAVDDLVGSLKEMRDALAVACRLIADYNLVDRFLYESRLAGVKDGVGVRAQAAIAAAAGRKP